MGRHASAHWWFYGVFGADTPFCVLVMLSNAKHLCLRTQSGHGMPCPYVFVCGYWAGRKNCPSLGRGATRGSVVVACVSKLTPTRLHKFSPFTQPRENTT